jgi:glucosyl-dolichyl phosphate glucuronosyltransferase
MHISVILCTYNRGQSLSQTLGSIAASAPPETVSWEVLVVDNNSTDDTRSVVEGFCRQYPGRFRYIFDAVQGKSHALNTGIQSSSAEILAFVDDDVIVDPNWLRNLTASLKENHWAGVGGQILPEQGFKSPCWIPLQDKYALAPLAVFTPDLGAGPLSEAPFGTNMAFRRSMFEKYGNFRTDLGPKPGSANPQKSEDSEFGHRLLAAGEQLRYEPSAIIYHVIPSDRLRKEYFVTWWYEKARADIRAFGIPTDTTWFIVGVPFYFFRRLARWTFQWMFSVNPRQRFAAKLKVWGRLGEIRECYRIAHDADGG